MSYLAVWTVLILAFLSLNGFGVPIKDVEVQKLTINHDLVIQTTLEKLQQSISADTSDLVSNDETVFGDSSTVLSTVDSDDYQFDADDDKHQPYTGKILRIKKNEIGMRSLVRNAIKWNKHEIPYYFKTTLEHVMRPVFEDAVKYYEKNSCLRFRELHHWEIGSRNYIEIVNGNVCASHIGQSKKSGKQPMSLTKGCDYEPIVLHELGHALGFHHSMWRYDRDNYVKVNRNNIIKEARFNFLKGDEWTNENYNLPYDLLSIMQYSDERMLAINKSLPVIEPKNPLYTKSMGDNFELTFIDLKMLNQFYDCTESCKVKIECYNGGFQNSNNCDECVCPIGFGGYRCLYPDVSQDYVTVCGDTLDATSEWRPLDAHFNRTCTWWIWAEVRKHVEIKFIHIDMTYSSQCKSVGLNVKLEDPLLTGFRICDPSMIPDVKEFKTEKNRAILNVYSNQKEMQHFLIMYRQVD